MDREKLTEQILSYLDGDLAPEEERSLAARIRGDAEAEKLLAEVMRLHGSVASVLQEQAGQQAAETEMAGTSTPPGGVPRARRGRFQARGRGGSPRTLVWIFSIGGAFAAVVLIAFFSGSSVRPIERPAAVRTQPAIPDPKPELPPGEERGRPAPPPPPLPPPRVEDPPPKLPAPEREPEPPLPRPVQPIPPPAPKPEPPPAPAPSPEPRTVVAVAAIARVERVSGEVMLILPSGGGPARESQPISLDSGLETGPDGQATIVYPDNTRLEVAPATSLAKLAEAPARGRIPGGKQVVFQRGQVIAVVTKQPAGQQMTFVTPHAEARVLGTTLRINVDPAWTRVEVKEGKVRLTRSSDGAFVDLGPDQYAVVTAGLKVSARRSTLGGPPKGIHLLEDFEDPLGVPARWQPLAGGLPSSTLGLLEIDLSPRPGATYAFGGWHAAGGLSSRQTFSLPLRVSLDFEHTHKHLNANALVVLVPKDQPAGSAKNQVAVHLRASGHGILVDGQPVKTVDLNWKAPLKERWTVELDRRDVRFLVDGKQILRHAHGLQAADEYRVELHASGKEDAPQGARARFDNVRIEP